ncbi:hypothetical protein AVEN_182796-1 [Araneus ventricosus]|uniref:Uncharacterized protein n=1 Tax=Araneus ventricosus TaxID=182803 RepID=A0A4Y2HQL7_ARAVE|nr:hypothetical protein AVEN_182796-1 [Araneus ventricosus]
MTSGSSQTPVLCQSNFVQTSEGCLLPLLLLPLLLLPLLLLPLPLLLPPLLLLPLLLPFLLLLNPSDLNQIRPTRSFTLTTSTRNPVA